jgi:nucleoside-diphosphate-sugar epimerase
MVAYVVVGAGPVGSAVARLFVARGEEVHLVNRSGSGPQLPGVTRVAADAADVDRMTELASGAAAIVNAANPAYHRWTTDWPPIAAALLTAAERSGATLVTVGNLYGYGPVDSALTEDLPLAATGRKGKVRARMWNDAFAAHEAGRARVTEVRGSDYLRPDAQSALGDRVMPRILAGRRVSVLPSADQPHTWTCVEDVARLVVVAASDRRAWGRAWHVPSNPPRTQREAIADLAEAAGVRTVRVGEIPKAFLTALSLVNPVLKEIGEVAYQFERPFVMDSSAAQSTFDLTPTPWEAMIAAQVAAYRS